MLPLSSVAIKSVGYCSPGQLVVALGFQCSALVVDVIRREGSDRGVILLKPGEVRLELDAVKAVISLQFEWEWRVDLWDGFASGTRNLQRRSGVIGLAGQRTLIVLDGGRCCDLSTYKVSKLPDELGAQAGTFGKWEIRTKPAHPMETRQTLYAFSAPGT